MFESWPKHTETHTHRDTQKHTHTHTNTHTHTQTHRHFSVFPSSRIGLSGADLHDDHHSSWHGRNHGHLSYIMGRCDSEGALYFHQGGEAACHTRETGDWLTPHHSSLLTPPPPPPPPPPPLYIDPPLPPCPPTVSTRGAGRGGVIRSSVFCGLGSHRSELDHHMSFRLKSMRSRLGPVQKLL